MLKAVENFSARLLDAARRNRAARPWASLFLATASLVLSALLIAVYRCIIAVRSST